MHAVPSYVGGTQRVTVPRSGRSGFPSGRGGERHFGCGRQSWMFAHLGSWRPLSQAAPSGDDCAANRLSQREWPTTVWSFARFLQAWWKSGRDRKCPSRLSFGGKSSPSRWRLGDRASSAVHLPLEQGDARLEPAFGSGSTSTMAAGFGRRDERGFSKRFRLCSRFQLVAEAARHRPATAAPVNNRLGSRGLAHEMRESAMVGAAAASAAVALKAGQPAPASAGAPRLASSGGRCCGSLALSVLTHGEAAVLGAREVYRHPPVARRGGDMQRQQCQTYSTTGGGQYRQSWAHSARLAEARLRELVRMGCSSHVRRQARGTRGRCSFRRALAPLRPCKAQRDVSASWRARSFVGEVLDNASCRLGNIVESLGARFDNKLVAEIDDRHLLLLAVRLTGRETRRERKAAAVAWRGGPSPGRADS